MTAKRGRDDGRIANRLAAEAESVTITYRRTQDDCVAVLVGYGSSYDARVKDADAQLPPGEWTRECVSTAASIYMDLWGRTDTKMPRLVFRKHEGKIVNA